MSLRSILPLLAVLASATWAPAQQQLTDLRVGHWVKAKGALSENGEFIVSAIELREPDDEEALTGTVSSSSGRTRFVVLGQEVHVSTARTKMKGVSPDNFAGVRLKVGGHYRGPWKFSARDIMSRDPGRDAIEGRVDQLEPAPGGRRLTIMRFQLFVPDSAELSVEADRAPDQITLAPYREFAQVPAESRGSDQNEDEVEITGRVAENLYFGGQLAYNFERRDNFDLNDQRARDRDTHGLTLRTELLWEPSESFHFLLGGSTTLGHRDDEGSPPRGDETTTLNEGYAYWSDLFGSGWDLQLGRQDFDERREWIYDQNLDAARLIHAEESWRIELSASTSLTGSDRDQDSTNVIAYLSNMDRNHHLAAYVVDRHQDSNNRATHLGARALGSWLPNNDSWLETVLVTGEALGREFRGVGVDLGTTWSPDTDTIPGLGLTAGFAYGSGDDSTGGTDNTFRQTGLNDNNGKLGGVTSFRYYGEIVDPELSNMTIATLGLGFRPTRRSSVDLLLHKYDQVEPVAGLADTNLRRAPDGMHTDLGWEADLVVGNRDWKSWHLELVLGYFHPGSAFPGGDAAWLGAFQVRYSF